MNSKIDYHNNFSFNGLKHHLIYSKEHILNKRTVSLSKETVNFLAKELKSIGNNITDIYIENLSVFNILNEIYFKLKESSFFEYNNFIKLFNKKDYFIIEISDNSSWILRLGKKMPEYIHIHPARVGKHTVRFPANTWKTALLCYYYKLSDSEFEFTLDTINYLRTSYLELSPIKKIIQKGNIGEAYNLLLT